MQQLLLRYLRMDVLPAGTAAGRCAGLRASRTEGPPWERAAAGPAAAADSLLLDRRAANQGCPPGPGGADGAGATDQLDDVGMVKVPHVGGFLQTLLNVLRGRDVSCPHIQTHTHTQQL